MFSTQHLLFFIRFENWAIELFFLFALLFVVANGVECLIDIHITTQQQFQSTSYKL